MKEKLRIGVVASNVLRLPPTAEYVPEGWSGAPEWSAYEITEGLVKKGHEVTLFASGDSETSARLESIHPVNSMHDPNIGINNHVNYELKLLSRAYEMARQGNFDIIHSHIPARSTFFATLVDIPTVTTLHSPMDRGVDSTLRNDSQYHVSISNAQREPAPNLNYVATIPHGVNLEDFDFSDNSNGYLIYAGRIVPEKGVDEAIKIAKMAGEKLLLLGSPPSFDNSYWKEQIEPGIDGKNIIYEGFVDRRKVPAYLSQAKAFLFPLRAREAFGTTMIESMACGTPVIAYSRGSVPEIVKDGETGFVIQETGDKEEDLEAMVRAVNNLGSISPLACRKHVEENFSIESEVNGYLSVYERLVNSN